MAGVARALFTDNGAAEADALIANGVARAVVPATSATTSDLENCIENSFLALSVTNRQRPEPFRNFQSLMFSRVYARYRTLFRRAQDARGTVIPHMERRNAPMKKAPEGALIDGTEPVCRVPIYFVLFIFGRVRLARTSATWASATLGIGDIRSDDQTPRLLRALRRLFVGRAGGYAITGDTGSDRSRNAPDDAATC
jgi:hypothetical protein